MVRPFADRRQRAIPRWQNGFRFRQPGSRWRAASLGHPSSDLAGPGTGFSDLSKPMPYRDRWLWASRNSDRIYSLAAMLQRPPVKVPDMMKVPADRMAVILISTLPLRPPSRAVRPASSV